jgi:hypothetical protein
LHLDSTETLEFDTSGGPINIYVDGGIDIDGGTIEVTDEDPVRVFNDGNFEFGNDGHVDTPFTDPHGPAFWVYMHPDASITFETGDTSRHFTGVIYAPGSGSGNVDIDKPPGNDL